MPPVEYPVEVSAVYPAIDNINQLDEMILQSKLVTSKLESQRKAVQALYSLVQSVATGNGPRLRPDALNYAFTCRHSPAPNDPDLSGVPIEVYTHLIRYLTHVPLQDLGRVENVFKRAVAWLRGIPIHKDWNTIQDHLKKQNPQWANSFNKDVLEYFTSQSEKRNHSIPFLVHEATGGRNLYISSGKTVQQISLVEAAAKVEDLEVRCPEVNIFLRFLCTLYAAEIPLILLELASVPRKYWGHDGKTATTTLAEGGALFCSILLDNHKIKNAIERLLSSKLISVKSTASRFRTLSIDSILRLHIEHTTSKEVWMTLRLEAIRLVCHVYPRCKDIEPLYEDLAILFRAQLAHVLAYRPELKLQHLVYLGIESQIAETCISALPFFRDKAKLLGTAKEIVEAYDLKQLRLPLALQEQELLRLYPDISQTGSNLEPIVHNPTSIVEFGELAKSRAYDLISANFFEDALKELERIPYSPNPTPREHVLREKVDLVAGMAYRNMGKFRQGLNLLEKLYKEGGGLQAHNPTGTSLICHLGAFYVELHQPIEAVVLLEDQRSVLQRWDWQHLRKGRQNLVYLAAAYLHLNPWRANENKQLLVTTLERRRISLRGLTDENEAEVFTRVQDPWTAVEEICLGLEKTWRLPSDADMVSKMLYLQLLTIHARVSLLQGHVNDALSRCEEALEIAGTCWSEGSFEMGIYRTISLIKFILGELEHSKAIESRANNLSINNPPRYWNVGFGTFWEKFLWKLSNKTKSDIQKTWQECLICSEYV